MDFLYFVVAAGEYCFEADNGKAVIEMCEVMNGIGEDTGADIDVDVEDDKDEANEAEEAIMMQVVNGLNMFDQFDEAAKEELCQHMEIKNFVANTTIFKQGEQGNHLYIILDGTAKVLSNVEGAGAVEIAKRSIGAYVGEQALVNSDSIRTATIMAETDMRTLVLHRDQFAQIKGSLDVLLVVAEKVPPMRLLDQTQRLELAGKMEELCYGVEDVILVQGEYGDAMYIIVKGTVRVDFETDDGKVRTLTQHTTHNNTTQHCSFRSSALLARNYSFVLSLIALFRCCS
jgi:CRP-like cAMP-binding protein